MGAITAAGTSLVEVAGIGVACKNHVTRTICDAIVWECGNIVNKLVDSVSGGLGGSRFLGENGAEGNKKFVVEHTYVSQEGANDTLDAFDAVRVKWVKRI